MKIISDTALNVTLPVWDYRTKWFTVGANYDIINSYFGFLISNGFDEEPNIHFEDFSSKIIYKISGKTDFNRDYSFTTKLGLKRPTKGIYRTVIEYSNKNYSLIKYKQQDINLLTELVIPQIYTALLIKVGHQKFNENNNFGINIGLEKSIKNFYTGFLIGYYSDYFNYSVYFQSLIYKSHISLRLKYDRIDDFDFFNIGLHFSLNKSYLVE